MPTVDVSAATAADQPVLRHLLELYAHDFSELTGAEVGDDGRYGYRHLDAYWRDPDRHPFLFRVDGRLAGFARFPGEWQVRELEANVGAVKFWRTAIPVEFTEDTNHEGPVQHYTMHAGA